MVRLPLVPLMTPPKVLIRRRQRSASRPRGVTVSPVAPASFSVPIVWLWASRFKLAPIRSASLRFQWLSDCFSRLTTPPLITER